METAFFALKKQEVLTVDFVKMIPGNQISVAYLEEMNLWAFSSKNNTMLVSDEGVNPKVEIVSSPESASLLRIIYEKF